MIEKIKQFFSNMRRTRQETLRTQQAVPRRQRERGEPINEMDIGGTQVNTRRRASRNGGINDGSTLNIGGEGNPNLVDNNPQSEERYNFIPSRMSLSKRIYIKVLMYLILMRNVYSGMLNYTRSLFDHDNGITFLKIILNVIFMACILFSMFGIVAYIINIFIDWGLGDTPGRDFRNMILNILFLHLPLLYKRHYLRYGTRV